MSERRVISARLPDDEYEAVHMLARYTGRSMNEVMRSAIRFYLAHQSPDQVQEVVQKADEAYERFRGTLDRLRNR